MDGIALVPGWMIALEIVILCDFVLVIYEPNAGTVTVDRSYNGQTTFFLRLILTASRS